MKKKINKGKIIGDTYYKNVEFSKAVLWKDRQISIPKEVRDNIRAGGVKTIVFSDEKKNERWVASIEEVAKSAIYKQEGQEPQFYIPIGIFKKERINRTESLF